MKQNSRSVLLLQIGILLLFFAFAAAVCTGLFSAAAGRSRSAAELSGATVCAVSAAETVRACGGDAVSTAAALGGRVDGRGVVLFYDGDWQPCAAGSAEYTALITLSELDGLVSAQITFSGTNGEILSLSCGAVKGGGGVG